MTSANKETLNLTVFRNPVVKVVAIGEEGLAAVELMIVDADRKLTSWGCGGKVGLLGGSSCTHTTTGFEQLSFISS